MTSPSNHPVLEALWERAESDWDNEAPHRALLEWAVQQEQLPELAGRYRALVDSEARGAMAQRRLDAIFGAALVLLHATTQQDRVPADSSHRVLLALASVLAIAVASGLAWVLLRAQ
jgi:hypothetical protein